MHKLIYSSQLKTKAQKTNKQKMIQVKNIYIFANNAD